MLSCETIKETLGGFIGEQQETSGAIDQVLGSCENIQESYGITVRNIGETFKKFNLLTSFSLGSSDIIANETS